MIASALLPAAWGLVVVAVGWSRRPAAKPRLDAVASRGRSSHRRRLATVPVIGLGRRLRALARRPPDPWADRRLGSTILAALGAAALSPSLGPPAAIIAWTLPWWRRRAAARRAEAEVVAELPEVVDLFALAAGAGLNVPLTLAAVAPRAGGAIGDALVAAQRRVDLGERTADALAVVPAMAGEVVRPLVAVLASSDRYGTPLLAALERLAGEVRLRRRRHAEEAARQLPVKLVFPLVLCTLPAFALLTVVPLLLGAFGSLRP